MAIKIENSTLEQVGIRAPSDKFKKPHTMLFIS